VGTSESQEEFPFPDISVITISINNGPPEVDLGTVHPLQAITILQSIVDSLKQCIMGPTIKYNDVLLYSSIELDDEDEND